MKGKLLRKALSRLKSISKPWFSWRRKLINCIRPWIEKSTITARKIDFRTLLSLFQMVETKNNPLIIKNDALIGEVALWSGNNLESTSRLRSWSAMMKTPKNNKTLPDITINVLRAVSCLNLIFSHILKMNL